MHTYTNIHTHTYCDNTKFHKHIFDQLSKIKIKIKWRFCIFTNLLNQKMERLQSPFLSLSSNQ